MDYKTFGSLFAGIGGFDLGFERAGLKCMWQCENNPFCIELLKKHWPNVQRFGDIKKLRNPPYVDVICGGFPCQDISNAGKRKGIKGERSGLWSEMLRIICEVRPKYVVVENVAALVNRGLSTVLGELAESGYDAEWQVLSAAAFGAPHLRERVFIVAYPNQFNDDSGGYGSGEISQQQTPKIFRGEKNEIHYAAGEEFPDWTGGEMGQPSPLTEFERPDGREVERNFCGVAYGVSNRVQRLKALGNAVVPQITEHIGRLIIECESSYGL